MKARSSIAILPVHVLLLATLFAAGNVGSAELVRQFTGSASTTTVEFEVKAPWILDWRVNSEYRKTMAIEVHLVDSLTGIHRGRVLRTKYAGNGVRLFNVSGRYKFRVSSTLTDWDLKIKELTREEAELYTPRERKGPLTL